MSNKAMFKLVCVPALRETTSAFPVCSFLCMEGESELGSHGLRFTSMFTSAQHAVPAVA